MSITVSHASGVKATLATDGTFTGLITGGVYAFRDIQPLGVSRKSTPAAFDSNSGEMLPVAVIRGRDPVPQGDIRDKTGPVISVRQTIEIWLYDGSQSYTSIDSALSRAIALLSDQQFTGYRLAIANIMTEKYDSDLRAVWHRLDVAATWVMNGGS
jgi:hypothetical protein